MAVVRIGVIGCAGRMGRMLVDEIVAAEGCTLAGGTASPGSPCIGQDAGELAGLGRLGIPVADDSEKLIGASDVVIEFTRPEATAAHVAIAAKLGKPIVVGTTGMSIDQEATIR